MKRLGLIATVALSSSVALHAQEGLSQTDNGFNKYSMKHIHESDIMWSKSVVRAMDLREQQNKPLFADKQEFSKLLLDAVREGVITPYTSDSLDEGSVLTLEEFQKQIIVPGSDVVIEEESEDIWADEPIADDGWGGGWGDEPAAPVVPEPVKEVVDENAFNGAYFEARDLYQLELNEKVIFDKQRSVLYYDIKSITLFIPADHPDNIRGIQTRVATFKYKELVEKVFKDNPKAIWFNPYNDSEHRNLEHAFEMRLFSSYLIKISNPKNEYIVDTYGSDGKTGIMASQWKAFEMLEYEHNLWEF